MNYTKCCISKSKNFNLVKINNNFLHPLNIIPLSGKYRDMFFNKKFYIHPNAISSFYSKKTSQKLGKFRVIYYNSNKSETITLPLNSRFFLLYYYVNNIQNINDINYIFASISYIDNNIVLDYDNDVVMYPSI